MEDGTTMKTRMPSELARSRTKIATTGGVVSKILKLLAIIGAAANYFVRPRHPPSAGGLVEGAAQGAEDVGPGSNAAGVNVEPDPEIIPITDAEIKPNIDAAIKPITDSLPEQQELERRRNIIRMLFNDFWSGIHDKPAAFVDRLDQAEDYVNERLAANGEFWRLDDKTRRMLCLPRRSNTTDSRVDRS
jgi:hypothetical protein